MSSRPIAESRNCYPLQEKLVCIFLQTPLVKPPRGLRAHNSASCLSARIGTRLDASQGMLRGLSLNWPD